jgi:hypothetical protein
MREAFRCVQRSRETTPEFSSPLALLGTVPMHDLHFVSRFPQPLLYILRDHYRAVLPARASEADGEVALALANVVWQQDKSAIQRCG